MAALSMPPQSSQAATVPSAGPAAQYAGGLPHTQESDWLMSTLSDLPRLKSNGARQREAPRSDGGVRGRRREAMLEEQTGKAASGVDAEKRGREWGRRRRARRGAGKAPKSKAGSGATQMSKAGCWGPAEKNDRDQRGGAAGQTRMG